jgi:hypothetical protein
MAAVVSAVWPAFGAHAADPPPPGIPMTLYGTASGAVPGQRVIAMVLDGTSLRACSDDPVYDIVLTSGGTVYRVSVNSDQTKTGCGSPGRQVFLYFAPLPGVDGRAATATIPWQGSASQGTVYESNVIVTAPLSNKAFVPVASDATK